MIANLEKYFSGKLDEQREGKGLRVDKPGY